jgi:hypothetical protein
VQSEWSLGCRSPQVFARAKEKVESDPREIVYGLFSCVVAALC